MLRILWIFFCCVGTESRIEGESS